MDKKTTAVIKKAPQKKLAISNYISLFDAKSTKKAKQPTISKTPYDSKVQPKVGKKSGHDREAHSTLTLPPEVDDSAAIANSPVRKCKRTVVNECILLSGYSFSAKTKASKFSKFGDVTAVQYAGESTKPPLRRT